ncbi:protein of unknown function DUF955 [Segniliparus rotundus DSM 44985]|uniref:IrrE N-terminal-like domain-containing protein n=1 Tax=Segniliparus rotundus (strain ATCC BAA-972 / CDC 1076 / CIP 108378 / DSM 44985 / JCM 13578) TaxID=640132 RepID=D6ZAQ3_SEGRD|nr:ImmA/IrrE family metallo-endopeptidase [Segniliparus rotundus]ADG98789.1 protein of unknown function DUF955 [Segniliparus rotundus DSM 44985]
MFVIDGKYHPWRHLAVKYPHVVVDCKRRLPGRRAGFRKGNHIWLCDSLDQAGRRSVLAHEIVHLERGDPEHHPKGRAAEELEVIRATARKLIPTRDLVEALKGERHTTTERLADCLWVDAPTLVERLESLDAIDLSDLEVELDFDWSVAMPGRRGRAPGLEPRRS